MVLIKIILVGTLIKAEIILKFCNFNVTTSYDPPSCDVGQTHWQ